MSGYSILHSLLQGHVLRWELLIRHWTHRQWWGESGLWNMLKTSISHVCISVLNVQIRCVTERKRLVPDCPPPPPEWSKHSPVTSLWRWINDLIFKLLVCIFNGLWASPELFFMKNLFPVWVHCTVQQFSVGYAQLINYASDAFFLSVQLRFLHTHNCKFKFTTRPSHQHGAFSPSFFASHLFTSRVRSVYSSTSCVCFLESSSLVLSLCHAAF